jgi:hypothetical protein
MTDEEKRAVLEAMGYMFKDDFGWFDLEGRYAGHTISRAYETSTTGVYSPGTRYGFGWIDPRGIFGSNGA